MWFSCSFIHSCCIVYISRQWPQVQDQQINLLICSPAWSTVLWLPPLGWWKLNHNKLNPLTCSPLFYGCPPNTHTHTHTDIQKWLLIFPSNRSSHIVIFCAIDKVPRYVMREIRGGARLWLTLGVILSLLKLYMCTVAESLFWTKVQCNTVCSTKYQDRYSDRCFGSIKRL